MPSSPATDNADTLHARGALKLARGEPGEALRLISTAMASGTPTPRMLFDLGLAFNALRQHQRALDSFDIEPLRADLMARLEHHRDRFAHYERILNKLFPEGTATTVADTGKLLGLRIGLRHERTVAEWCEEAIEALSAITRPAGVLLLEDIRRENNG